MVEPQSPLQPVWRPGRHGKMPGNPGVVLTETRPGAIVQVAAWPGKEKAVITAIRKSTGLALPDGAGGGVVKDNKSAFGFAPGRFLVVDQASGMEADIVEAVSAANGTVTMLTHGRTAIRLSGPKAEWVLAKFFALDFALAAFPAGAGRSTAHHEIFAQIQRVGADRFDVYVFRSFARSFWTALCHASAEIGYEVR